MVCRKYSGRVIKAIMSLLNTNYIFSVKYKLEVFLSIVT